MAVLLKMELGERASRHCLRIFDGQARAGLVTTGTSNPVSTCSHSGILRKRDIEAVH